MLLIKAPVTVGSWQERKTVLRTENIEHRTQNTEHRT